MVVVIPFIYSNRDEIIANSYICYDDNKNAVVIDPSVKNDGLSKYIKDHNLNLKGVLLTHGHFDHIRGVDILIERFNCPLYVGEDDIELLTNSFYNCSTSKSGFGKKVIVEAKPIGLVHDEILNLLEEDIKVIHTPYHTCGGVCYYLDNSKIIFTGDSLFKYGIGRYDLPTSIPNKMNKSLKLLMSLDDEVVVYPGHGSKTTIQEERKHI